MLIYGIITWGALLITTWLVFVLGSSCVHKEDAAAAAWLEVVVVIVLVLVAPVAALTETEGVWC